MSNLSPAQIMDLAAAAGFTGADLPTAVAVALAESGGNPNDYNSETAARGGTPIGQGSFGLWQIYLRDHPEFAGWPLFDPPTNALAAYRVYAKAGGFRPWTTYTEGEYQAFLHSVPLVLDASTGAPVTNTPPPTSFDTSTIDESAGFPVVEAGVLPSSISPSTVLILAAAGLLVLYLIEG